MSEPVGLFTAALGALTATPRELEVFRRDPARITAFLQACQARDANSRPAVTVARDLAALRDDLVGFLAAAGTAPRLAQAQARDLILERWTGLTESGYYQYLRLADRLAPAAQELALQSGLPESRLRPVVTHVPDPDQQVACIRAIAAHGLSRRKARRLVEAVRSGADPAVAASQLTQPRDQSSPWRPRLGRQARPLWDLLDHVVRELAHEPDPAAATQRLQELAAADQEHIQIGRAHV